MCRILATLHYLYTAHMGHSHLPIALADHTGMYEMIHKHTRNCSGEKKDQEKTPVILSDNNRRLEL